ncbi:SH3 domain-containing protein [Labrys neptuniae]
MPFYIRKPVSAGPFRFNFSKGGVGVSVGVKGLRIGIGPRGHYIHAGRGGLYYRASLGNAGRRSAAPTVTQPLQPVITPNDDVAMIEVESGDVMQMRDESFGEMLDEINAKVAQIRMSVALCWTMIGIGLVAGFVSGGPGLVLAALALPAWAIGRWFDSYRRSVVLYYDLEGDAEAAYNRLAEGFDGLSRCVGKWHIEAGGVIQSLTAWKRNAGASHLVQRKATTLTHSLPLVIKSNVSAPAIGVGKQTMFFMPDVVFIQDGNKVGAVSYADLRLRWQNSRFIETERVPSDAQVVDHTWKHPNKNGGPDRRFKDNRQIPICLYETLHFQSDSGVNEIVEFSQTGKAADFADGCLKLARLPREKGPALPSPASATPATHSLEPPVGQEKKRAWGRGASIGIAAALLLPLAAILFKSKDEAATTRPGKDVEQKVSNQLANGPFTDEAGVNVASPTSSLNVDNPPTPQPQPSSISNTPPTRSTLAPSDPKPSATSGSPSGTPGIAAPLPVVHYTNTALNLRDGPGSKYRVISALQKNSKVEVLDEGQGWSLVRLESGATGWVFSKALTKATLNDAAERNRVAPDH